MIDTLFERYEGFSRLSESMNDFEAVETRLDAIAAMPMKTEAERSAKWNMEHELWQEAVGNTQREPVMSFINEQLLDALDEIYLKSFGGRVDGVVSSIEMSFSNWALLTTSDENKYDKAHTNYQKAVKDKIWKMAKTFHKDPTRSAFERALWGQLPAKVEIFLSMGGHPLKGMPWLPFLTKSSLHAINTRLSMTSEAIVEVSSFVRLHCGYCGCSRLHAAAKSGIRALFRIS